MRTPSYELTYQIREENWEHVSKAIWSPDGQFLAVSSSDNYVRIYDGEHFDLRTTLEGHTMGISDIHWSGDGKYLISGADDQTCRVWDLEIGKPIKTLKEKSNNSAVMCCMFNPQQNMIATGHEDGQVKMWDVRSGSLIHMANNSMENNHPAHSECVCCLDFVEDGTLMLTGSYDGLVRIWSTRERHCTNTIGKDSAVPISAARFTPNAKYVLVATMNSTIKLIEFAIEKCCKTYVGHTNEKYCSFIEYNVHKDPYLVMAGGEDGTIHAWNLQSKSSEFILPGHDTAVMSLSLHPQHDTLASASLGPNAEVKIWSRCRPGSSDPRTHF